jgi:hypothetical protein
MNSRRLHGVHRVTDGLLVQIDPGDHRQAMTKL